MVTKVKYFVTEKDGFVVCVGLPTLTGLSREQLVEVERCGWKAVVSNDYPIYPRRVSVDVYNHLGLSCSAIEKFRIEGNTSCLSFHIKSVVELVSVWSVQNLDMGSLKEMCGYCE